MPFCDTCARHWTPPAMKPDGSCPTCGAVLAKPVLAEHAAEAAAEKPAKPVPKAPWHFKLLLGSLAVYLGWRAIQGVEWLAGRL